MNSTSLLNQYVSKSQLLIRPVSWSILDPKLLTTKNNYNLNSSIEIFGYTNDDRSIYIRIPQRSTFILKFFDNIDTDITANIKEILSPTSIKVSTLDSTTLIIRAPKLSPFELIANHNSENIANWIDAKQDPYGPLESLWEAIEISPYEWIKIDKYMPLPGKYTSCDLNIASDELFIKNLSSEELPTIKPRLLFFDIKTTISKPGEISNSNNPDDSIFMISVIIVNNEECYEYIIIKDNINTNFIDKDSQTTTLIRAKDEKDLIIQFFGIYSTFKPDRSISYNGDMFDIPYLLNRISMNNIEIPKISKVLSITPSISYHDVITPFGIEKRETIIIPGTEILDLFNYYRLFYPNLKNHKLNTISGEFLDQRKFTMGDNQIIEALKTNDPDKIANIVDYSFIDILRISELWDHNSIQLKVETICNNLGISTDTLLRKDINNIIDLAVYNIDAGSALMGGKIDKPNHLKDAIRGIYRNVFIYDYSELYRNIMLMSKEPIINILANRLEGAPPHIILSAFYSKYIDRTNLLPEFTKELNNIISTKTIIAIQPTIIISIGPLIIDWLKIINTKPFYISVSNASYIILNNNSEIDSVGISKLCRPKFELANDIIRQYFNLAYSNEFNKFKIPDLKTLPIDKFILSENIGNISELEPGTIKHILSIQYGSNINSWISVKYVMTNNGPILLSLLTPDIDINYSYYNNELNKYIKDLQSLKLYGV